MKSMKKWKALALAAVFLGMSGAVSAGSCYPSYSSSSAGMVFPLFLGDYFLLFALNNPAFAMAMANAAAESLPSFYEPSSSGAWTWVVDASAKYSVSESLHTFTPDAHLRAWRADLNAHMVGDRLTVTFNVPYRQWKGYGIYELFDMDGESIGLNILPQYFIFREDSECYDLSVFAMGGYEHVWFKDNPGFDDMDFLNLGIGAMVAKSFDFGRLSLLYGFLSRVNIDGDDMLSGNKLLNTHNTVLSYSFGITDDIYGSLQGIWQYTPSLPSGYDANTYKGRASLGYATESWMVEVAYGRTLASTNFREYEVELSAGYRW